MDDDATGGPPTDPPIRPVGAVVSPGSERTHERTTIDLAVACGPGGG